MAHLIRQQKTYYTDPAGKRVPKGTPGAKKVREKSAKWYGVGIPGYPPKKRVPLAADKAAARRMLDDLIRRGEQGQAGMPDRDAGRRKLSAFLADFEADLALGLASKNGRKGRTPSTAQVALIVQRVRDILAGCEFDYPTDLNSDSAAKLARYLRARVPLARKDGGMSAQTADYFMVAARRFVRWLSARAAVRADLFDTIPGFNPSSDRKHARRNIDPDELARLLDKAESSTVVVRRLAGRDRFHLYLTAFSTGYRAGELAELMPANFDLDADPPMVSLPARFNKNRKASRQPLPPGVAARLRDYLAGRPADQPVWPGTWADAPVRVLRHDLKAAGVPYVVNGLDGPRYADFHSLRHSYLSALAAAGVGVKELQTLARHSDPRLTLGIYTHTSADALGAAVGRLVMPGDVANPLAAMSRSDLETAVAGLLGVIGVLLGTA